MAGRTVKAVLSATRTAAAVRRMWFLRVCAAPGRRRFLQACPSSAEWQTRGVSCVGHNHDVSATIEMITGDPAADEVRRQGLRRMRTLAVSLLLLAALVYALTLGQDGFWGFVNAGAEASMVGAIADWFAVTALFRHPLGIPVPHTALIPKRKDQLGQGLQEFVGENFLQEGVIRERSAAPRSPCAWAGGSASPAMPAGWSTRSPTSR